MKDSEIEYEESCKYIHWDGECKKENNLERVYTSKRVIGNDQRAKD